MRPLEGAMENFGPFNDVMGKLETNKEMGEKLCVCVGGVNYLMGKWEIGPLMAQWNIGPFDDTMGKLETIAMGKLAPDDLMGKLGGPRPLDNVMGN